MKRNPKIKSKDGKIWATIQKKSYGYLVLLGRSRDGRNHGHFEIHLPSNKLGTKHPRGFIKEIRRNNEVVFSDLKAKKTRTIKIKTDTTGSIQEFAFIES